MQVNVQSIHFDADDKLVSFIHDRVNKLDLFSDRIIESDVYLRLNKSESKENKVAEIKVSLPGKELFAKRQCKSFEEATDLAIDALRRQIKRYKGKKQAT